MDRRNIVYRPRPILVADLDINIKRAHERMDELYYASIYDSVALGEVWSTVEEIIGYMANCKKLCYALQMKEIIAKETIATADQRTEETTEQKTDKETEERSVSELAPINDRKVDNKPKRRQKQR